MKPGCASGEAFASSKLGRVAARRAVEVEGGEEGEMDMSGVSPLHDQHAVSVSVRVSVCLCVLLVVGVRSWHWGLFVDNGED